MKETDITKQILDMLNYIPGCFAYKHWGGPMGMRGVHDIICCYRGKFISIEVKSPNLKKAEYSKYQKIFADKVDGAEGIAMCVQSADEVKEILGLNVKLFPLFANSNT